MASTAPITSRRAMLGAIALVPAIAATASAAPPSQTPWQRAFDRYRLLHGLITAEESFGAMGQANAVHDEERARVARKVGCAAKEVWRREDGRSLLKASFDAVELAEKRFAVDWCTPYDAAAVALVLTPAPDIDAILYKVDVIERHDLSGEGALPRDPMSILLDDAQRLGVRS